MVPQPARVNPYIAGRALDQDRGFFGRADVLQVVESALSSTDHNALVLSGQRRIGKSSILRQLQRRLPKEPCCAVYFDLMDCADQDLGRVLASLAATMARAVGLPKPDAEQFDNKGDFFQHDFLPDVYARLGEGRRPVLLLDEFDVLDTPAEQLAETVAARSFFPYLRRLMQHEPRLAFVFVVGRKPEELSTNFMATFKAARFLRVSVLKREDAEKLIRTAEAQGTLTFAPEAVERILALTSGHPYFTQLLCQLLWDRHSEGGALVTPQQVDQVVPDVLEAGENILVWIWDGLPPAERLIFSTVAKATEERPTVTKDDLVVTLQGHGIRMMMGELDVAPDTLVDWEMLTRQENGEYRFLIELMRQWVLKRKPLLKVKDELDRVVPAAETFYQAGHTDFKQGDFEAAILQFEKALRHNPNHLRARMRLAEARMAQGDLAGAAKEYEEAYRYDEERVRYPLVACLLQHAESLRTPADLDVYRRVLQISPREKVAGERLNAILLTRGNKALETGDFASARAAFTEAGDEERLLAVEVAEKLEQRRTVIEKVEALLAREEYAAAIPLIESLAAIDSSGWQARLEEARMAQSIKADYSQGLGALAQDDFKLAIQALAKVVHADPLYRDAASLLAGAVEKGRAPGVPFSLHYGEPEEKPAVNLTGIVISLGVSSMCVGIWGVRTIAGMNDNGGFSAKVITIAFFAVASAVLWYPLALFARRSLVSLRDLFLRISALLAISIVALTSVGYLLGGYWLLYPLEPSNFWFVVLTAVTMIFVNIVLGVVFPGWKLREPAQ